MYPEDDESAERTTSHRRRFLRGMGAAGLAGAVAGCLGGGDDENGEDDSTGGENGDGENGDGENGDGENGDGDNGNDPEPASFAVSGLDPEETTVARGETVDVAATIENTGDEEGTQEVELQVDGDAVGSDELTVDGGEEADVSFSVDTADLDAGEYEHAIVTEDDEASGALTVEALLEDPDELLSFGDDPRLVTGTSPLSGTIENPYPVAVEDGEVELAVPEGWEIVGEEGTTFDAIEDGESQEVSWELEVPEDAAGEHELTADVGYAALDETADVSVTANVDVVAPMSAPFGMDCGGAHTDETVEIDGLEFLPTPEQAQELELDMENRPLEDDEKWWPDALTIEPEHSESPGALDEERPLTQEEDREAPPDIEGTEYDSLYWTEHWGTEMNYHFTIENGAYEVTVHLAEIWEEGRLINLEIGGETVVEGLDLYNEYGPDTAVTYTSEVEVEDNELVVSFSGNVPKVSGIEIREA